MNILVTGAKGQLGSELRRLSGWDCNNWVFTDLNADSSEGIAELDVLDTAAVAGMLESESIGLIINCASFTDVEKAEVNEEASRLLNAFAPGNLAGLAAKAGAGLLHISSDFVFPGDGDAPLREEDPTGPLNVYGRTKLEGEKAVLESGCEGMVIRTAWLYSPYGTNFVKKILGLMEERDVIDVVSDQVGSPTSAADLASFIIYVIRMDAFGQCRLCHFTGEGQVSRYEFACAIKEISGSSCEVRPCCSADYPSKARRPLFSALDCGLAWREFGFVAPYWKDSLRECMSRMV